MQKLTLDDRFPSMPWDLIDNVVFDVGNVLVAFSPSEILHDTLPDHPELYETLQCKVFRSPYWIMLDRGEMNPAQAAEAMIGRDNELSKPIQRVMRDWVDLKHVITEGVEALKICHAHGKRLYVLSNYGKEPFDFIQQKYDFFRLFDGMVISSHVHLLKPSAEIYRCLTDTYSLNPARTLFIDDTPANVEGALNVGWQGFCYNRPGKLRAFFGEEA